MSKRKVNETVLSSEQSGEFSGSHGGEYIPEDSHLPLNNQFLINKRNTNPKINI
jgi:hypothetical protein